MTSNPKRIKVAELADLEDRVPAHALISNTDLVLITYDENVSVLYGRCLHREAWAAVGDSRPIAAVTGDGGLTQ